METRKKYDKIEKSTMGRVWFQHQAGIIQSKIAKMNNISDASVSKIVYEFLLAKAENPRKEDKTIGHIEAPSIDIVQFALLTNSDVVKNAYKKMVSGWNN